MTQADQQVDIEDLLFKAETRARHAAAVHASDVDELRRNLAEAAWRFNDLADMIEKDGVDARNHTGFMRASARRYWRVAGEKVAADADGKQVRSPEGA